MHGNGSAGLLWARLLAAVGIVAVVVGMTAAAFAREGLTPAAGWFQLTQGVGGVALGWLFTSQGMDAALIQAAEEAREAERARQGGMDLEGQLRAVQEDAERLRRLLDAAVADPSTRSKLETVTDRMESEDP